jgi:hypothetical protein
MAVLIRRRGRRRLKRRWGREGGGDNWVQVSNVRVAGDCHGWTRGLAGDTACSHHATGISRQTTYNLCTLNRNKYMHTLYMCVFTFRLKAGINTGGGQPWHPPLKRSQKPPESLRDQKKFWGSMPPDPLDWVQCHMREFPPSTKKKHVLIPERGVKIISAHREELPERLRLSEVLVVAGKVEQSFSTLLPLLNHRLFETLWSRYNVDDNILLYMYQVNCNLSKVLILTNPT